MYTNFLPHKTILKKYVQYVLDEDLTYNDLTTELTVEEDREVEAIINFREAGIVCGLPFAREVYNILDPGLNWEELCQEGSEITSNTDAVRIFGSAKAILTGERTALNLIQKASGIATITNKYVKKLTGSTTKLTDTRKTTPGARILEKYSIKVGGAIPHRYNLSDSVLIKDNHIFLAGSISSALRNVKKQLSHTAKVEVETENEGQVKEALEGGADIIMLDNMTPAEVKRMVDLIAGKAITEASGNVSYENLEEFARTGVDYISTSAITIKAPVLDVGMDMRPSVIYL
jgi:nicotinate-nucleotide pyrophosphorylase (carboxylating)